MGNHTTGAQRYNARMDKIFSEAKRLKAIYCGHSEHEKFCKCEDVKGISEENLRDWWSKDTTIRVKDILYRIGRMSYGNYFLEPRSWNNTGHGEKDGHSPVTDWFYLKDAKKRIYGLESNR